ncbi:hypothetical protein EDEG_01241 [Edhazardia aedis USNM 41457]|uniref:Uncharacterized protein n=1 Tax=Edhazardia aedis (strain USNM 41457) TaxID=1003232 RepID=J8ZY56_EDHAE|nr:hypothetical protein EDEG_01241 [Edhazardia aedis USNM 41457]|eukprot:EJW04558.1 hypothetical protein EDEG_01241 [Edhazardia aedis USNM 41457]
MSSKSISSSETSSMSKEKSALTDKKIENASSLDSADFSKASNSSVSYSADKKIDTESDSSAASTSKFPISGTNKSSQKNNKWSTKSPQNSVQSSHASSTDKTSTSELNNLADQIITTGSIGKLSPSSSKTVQADNVKNWPATNLQVQTSATKNKILSDPKIALYSGNKAVKTTSVPNKICKIVRKSHKKDVDREKSLMASAIEPKKIEPQMNWPIIDLSAEERAQEFNEAIVDPIPYKWALKNSSTQIVPSDNLNISTNAFPTAKNTRNVCYPNFSYNATPSSLSANYTVQNQNQGGLNNVTSGIQKLNLWNMPANSVSYINYNAGNAYNRPRSLSSNYTTNPSAAYNQSNNVANTVTQGKTTITPVILQGPTKNLQNIATQSTSTSPVKTTNATNCLQTIGSQAKNISLQNAIQKNKTAQECVVDIKNNKSIKTNTLSHKKNKKHSTKVLFFKSKKVSALKDNESDEKSDSQQNNLNNSSKLSELSSESNISEKKEEEQENKEKDKGEEDKEDEDKKEEEGDKEYQKKR